MEELGTRFAAVGKRVRIERPDTEPPPTEPTISATRTVPTAAAAVFVRLFPSRIADSSECGRSSSRATRAAPGAPSVRRTIPRAER